MSEKCLNCGNIGIYKKKVRSNVASFFKEYVLVEEEVWQCDLCGEAFLTDEYKDFSNEIFKAIKKVKEGDTKKSLGSDEKRLLSKLIRMSTTRNVNNAAEIFGLKREVAGLRRILFGNVNRIGYTQVEEIKVLEKEIKELKDKIRNMEKNNG